VRRVRSALALTLVLAACGGAPEEDFRARFLAGDWDGVAPGWRAADLAAGLRAYTERDGPILPRDDRRVKELIAFLVRARPKPAALAPLLASPPHETIDDATMRRDLIAFAVVSSFRLLSPRSTPAKVGLLAASGTNNGTKSTREATATYDCASSGEKGRSCTSNRGIGGSASGSRNTAR
jgi:hypothetical protein